MASPRLPFLYPNLFRAIRSCEPTTYRSIRAPPSKPNRKAKLHTTRQCAQGTVHQRYGPALSGDLPPPPKPAEPLLPKDQQSQRKDEANAASRKDERNEPPPEKREDDPENKSADTDTTITPKVENNDNAPGPKAEEMEPLQNKELDIVLSIPSPSELKGESHRHRHLETPPYEHHFDTYSLVNSLSEQAYTTAQSITLMKTIRLMLAENLDTAKDGLVSKSDTENETYLFRAACSELRTTLLATRRSETLKQRSQRAQLQHEYDILNQKVTQDMMTMREELKGMFNDRKLRLEEEKRKVDGKISELNYEITVLLNSEAKSKVEGLRWVLTRRAATAIGVCARKCSNGRTRIEC